MAFGLVFTANVVMRQSISQGEDSELATALAAGDDDRAMEILVDRHADDVYRYCRRLLGNDSEGDDAAQTVYAQAFADLARLAQVRSARAWLLGIARHRCIDRLKVLRRAPQPIDHDELISAADRAGQPTELGGELEPRVREALDDCMDRLDARSRMVLVLRFHDELSYEQIGELTADTPGALRVRVARALPVLRRCIESKQVAL